MKKALSWPERHRGLRSNRKRGLLCMGALGDPFKLFGRLLIACFKIIAYCISYGAQALWCLFHGRPDKVGDAIGELGRSVTDAIGEVFRE